MGGVKPAVSCQCQTTPYHWNFWYCFYNIPNFFFFSFWAFGFGLGFALGLFLIFLFSTLALHEGKFKSIQKWNFTTVRQWRSVQLVLQKGDAYPHTHQHTQYIRSDVHSVLPSLSHIVSTHKSTQEKLSASSFRKVVLEQRQNSWMKSHLKYNMLLNCIKSYRSVPYFKLLVCVYKLKLTIAKCLLSPLHARTQPGPATRAQDQSMDQPSTLKIAPIPFWHIAITMKQHAICCSWISQTLNIEFTIVKAGPPPLRLF